MPDFPILSAIKLTSCEQLVFTDIYMSILTEGRNFKIILKENYAVALKGCYLFTKKMFKHDIN